MRIWVISIDAPFDSAWFALRVPCLTIELLRTRRAAHAKPGIRDAAFLSTRSGMGTIPGGDPGHRGHGHRFPGHNQRRFFSHQTGCFSWSVSSRSHRANIFEKGRSDLYPKHQLGAHDRDRGPRARVPKVEQTRCSIRYCGFDDDGHHDFDRLCGCARKLGVAVLSAALVTTGFLDSGYCLFRRKHVPRQRRGLDTVDGRRVLLSDHVDMETGTNHRLEKTCQKTPCRWMTS